ncbi:hypothetical protein B0H19DRAFT_517938 [Mycena capillaripes]|nr:hypothetical protein B0H19DRAFT_517938 [Mycena capillaripes]
MHRRGNKSKKVPNVRLRPAQPDAMARARASPEHTSCWTEEGQINGEEDKAIIGGSCPRPFKNVVICVTGILDKPALFKLALELGATSVSAFTDRVTHLVAENHGGAKYLCALERKIPILLPSWITESHRVWQHGDDVDLAESVAAHRLPVFCGVTLCTSGIPEIVRRTKINKALTAAGGTYVADLDSRVTHLLCAGDTETDKMRDAEELNRARGADPPIQLVWEEWFWDSLEYGGRFDEKTYQVRAPRPARRDAASAASNAHDPSAISTADNPANSDDAELAPVHRRPALALQLWGSLLKARGYELARGGVVLSANAMALALQPRTGDPEAPARAEAQDTDTGTGVLSRLRRANSILAPRTTAAAAAAAGARAGPFARTKSSMLLGKRPATSDEGDDGEEGGVSVKRGRMD